MTQQLHYRYLPQRYRCSEKKPIFIAAMSTTAKLWKELRCLQRMNGWTRSDSCTSGILLSHQKGWILTIFTDMDETGGDYAKWNKSSRERQLLYGFTHMWNISNSTEAHVEGREIQRGRNQRGRRTMRNNGPWETIWGFQSGRRVGGEEVRGWWVLRRACAVMSTGCYI